MAVPQAEGYDPQFFAQVAALEDDSFWFRERNRLILWALRRYAGDLRDYLEVGCGTGYVLDAVHSEFPAARCVGLEPFEAALEIDPEVIGINGTFKGMLMGETMWNRSATSGAAASQTIVDSATPLSNHAMHRRAAVFHFDS